jgi:hypothetical protein
MHSQKMQKGEGWNEGSIPLRNNIDVSESIRVDTGPSLLTRALPHSPVHNLTSTNPRFGQSSRDVVRISFYL